VLAGAAWGQDRVSERRSANALFGRRLLTVTGIDELGAYRVLRVADPDGPVPRPGQFTMLAAAERWGAGEDERPYLARAFSVARWLADRRSRRSPIGGEAHYLLEDVGPGTRRLCELAAGDEVWALGPLGQGFTSPQDGRRALLVGGGVGIAPLVIWRDELEREAGLDMASSRALSTAASNPASMVSSPAHTVLLGFRDGPRAKSAALLPGARVATDDGSVGYPGLITDLLEEELARDAHATVYACGPAPMLEAVRALCAARNVPAQLALEAGMACGFGACYGCVVPKRGGGYLRVCVDGPVIGAAELDQVEAHAGGAGGTR
jgi:dihydroorotate dehydrogenase electron transfer subunit